MKFFVDAHFPVRLKRWLIENGDDAIHTSDMEKKNRTSDLEIIKKAGSEKKFTILI